MIKDLLKLISVESIESAAEEINDLVKSVELLNKKMGSFDFKVFSDTLKKSIELKDTLKEMANGYEKVGAIAKQSFNIIVPGIEEFLGGKNEITKQAEIVQKSFDIFYESYDKIANKIKEESSDVWKKVGDSIGYAGEAFNLFEGLIGESWGVQKFANAAKESLFEIVGSVKEVMSIFGTEALSKFEQVYSSVGAIGGAVSSMGQILGGTNGILSENAAGWVSWAGNLLATVASVLPQLLALFGVQSALAVTEQAALPFPMNIIAIGATMAAVAGAILSFPKPKEFASGGIVYGDTLARVGEYPGASSNPEVIAPLNKLRSLLGSNSEVSNVEFRIRGNDLVGVINKQNKMNSRL